MKLIDDLLKNRFFVLFLFLLAFGVYLFNSWGVSIYILDEAKNSSCAREMLEMKHWFVPTFNYELRTDKPPLHYFFMMLAYSVFGVNAFAARFFSAVFGAFTILVSFVYTRRFTNARTAFWTAIVLLSSIHLSLQFHLAVPDPYLIFFMTWSMFAFFAALHSNNKYEWLWMYVSVGLATLTKGPVAILLPGLIFLFYLIFSKSFSRESMRKLKPFYGVVVVLLIVLPWYILNGVETQWEWTRGFFLEHNLHRFSDEKEGHGGIFLITFAFVLIGLFPFAVFLPQSIVFAFKDKKQRFILFSLIAGLTIVAFFSVSQTKLPNYTVPAYPFLAVIIAYFIANKLTNYKQVRIAYIVMLTLSILIPITAFVAMDFDPSLALVRRLSMWLLVLPVLALMAFFYRKKLITFLFFTGLSGLLTALMFFGVIYPGIDRQNPVAQSVGMLKNHEVAYYGKFNASYSFYLQKKINRIEGNEIDDFFQQHPDGIIISTKRRIEQLKLETKYEIIFSGRDLFEKPTTVLISAKKN